MAKYKDLKKIKLKVQTTYTIKISDLNPASALKTAAADPSGEQSFTVERITVPAGETLAEAKRACMWLVVKKYGLKRAEAKRFLKINFPEFF